MAKQNSTQNQSNITITLEAEFKHHTSIGPSGEVLYDAPMEIKDQADLDAYGITWDDCRTLNFHGSEKVTVYFFKTPTAGIWSFVSFKSVPSGPKS